jgi:hypothetical protein
MFNKTIMLTPVPEGKITSGKVESIYWDHRRSYEFETNVDFFLADDGYVYAQVCRLEDLPEAE